MGKTRIIAETGAGQHGMATATVCALFDLPCVVYMGEAGLHRNNDSSTQPSRFNSCALDLDGHVFT